MILAFHKPYGVISQFSDDGSGRPTLAGFGFPKRVYPLGRLDADSEGLLLLSDEKDLNHRLLHPTQGHERMYWVQVERVPDDGALDRLAEGVDIRGYRTQPCRVRMLEADPDVAPRDPPVRFRKNVPTAWLEMTLHEGKNRQVRRMSAAVGFPTLRLIRVRIGGFGLFLPQGKWKRLVDGEREMVLLSSGSDRVGERSSFLSGPGASLSGDYGS